MRGGRGEGQEDEVDGTKKSNLKEEMRGGEDGKKAPFPFLPFFLFFLRKKVRGGIEE